MTEILFRRRQFLLTRVAVNGLPHWSTRRVGPYYLYSHPDLEVESVSTPDREVVLLGYVFDARSRDKSNIDILRDLHSGAADFRQVLTALKPMAGRYVLLFRDSDGVKVVQDALSLREVYYSNEDNASVCASQPTLLSEFSEPRLERSKNPEVLEFYHHHMRHVRNGRLWVGDGCLFDGIRHLLPNHYLDLERRAVSRYWPDTAWGLRGLDDTVTKACEFLQGMMEAITNRHRVMIAVTAGTDSRTLLAASRAITDRVYYFVNQSSHLTPRSSDIRVPVSMFRKIGVPFHVHTVEQDVDPEFRKAFYASTFFASDRLLPAIYNIYYRQHSEKVNVLGVGEVGRALWGKAPRRLDAYYLAYSLGYARSTYARKECDKWLAEVLPAARSHGIDVMSLLLWEQLLGNWGAVGNSESDIAIEEFDPYDSHYMYETLLGIDEAAIGGDRQRLFREMIRRMWPTLLEFPINPSDSVEKSLKHALKTVGVYTLLKRLKYQWHWHRHGRN
jgi:hypothetical protein